MNPDEGAVLFFARGVLRQLVLLFTLHIVIQVVLTMLLSDMQDEDSTQRSLLLRDRDARR